MRKVNLKNAKSGSQLVKSNDKYKINSEKKLNKYIGKEIICKTFIGQNYLGSKGYLEIRTLNRQERHSRGRQNNGRNCKIS